MRGLPPPLAAWHARGVVVRVLGREVFTLTEGAHDHAAGPPAGARDAGEGDPPAAAPRVEGTLTGDADPLLVLHGFPSSSFDFRPVLSALAARRRVILHDHIGFGLSDKPARFSYSLLEQADVALAVWRELGVRRGHLLAHDYGTSVATELIARRERGLLPIELSSVTLCNGSVHIELADLTPSQRLLRSRLLGPLFVRLVRPPIFKAQLRRILGRPDAVSEDELDLMWAGIERADGHLRMPQLSAYIDERYRFHERWIGALTRLDVPAHVLWGRRDPVAIPAIASALAAEIPGARLSWLDDLGHYPMLEAPDRWAAAVTSFLDGLAPRGDP